MTLDSTFPSRRNRHSRMRSTAPPSISFDNVNLACLGGVGAGARYVSIPGGPPAGRLSASAPASHSLKRADPSGMTRVLVFSEKSILWSVWCYVGGEDLVSGCLSCAVVFVFYLVWSSVSQGCAHMVGHRIPDRLLRVAIQNRCQIDESLPGANIGNIATHFILDSMVFSPFLAPVPHRLRHQVVGLRDLRDSTVLHGPPRRPLAL